jgi:hypothetical protein
VGQNANVFECLSHFITLYHPVLTLYFGFIELALVGSLWNVSNDNKVKILALGLNLETRVMFF